MSFSFIFSLHRSKCVSFRCCLICIAGVVIDKNWNWNEIHLLAAAAVVLVELAEVVADQQLSPSENIRK